MRQSRQFEYRDSSSRCKHIRLTLITPVLLLFVACHSPQPAPPVRNAASSTGSASSDSSSQASAITKTSNPSTVTASPRAPAAGSNWQSLFDGKTLQGWAVTDFAGHGEVKVENGSIILSQGVMTGINWTNPMPAQMSYEIALDAMRVDGSDFFCGLTFPVGKDPCSFIVGGWGGGVVGLSSLDGEDAANNETTKVRAFETGKWYGIRVRVEPARIQAWIDDEKYVEVVTTDHRLSIRVEVEPSLPLGIASWSTTAGLKNIRMRKL
jgi:hypothetical protein